MATFFEIMRRMVKGEPAFQSKQNSANSLKPAADATEANSQVKLVPQVEIVRENCRIDGQRMVCDVEIQNTSNQPVHLDDIRIFNVKRELQRGLGPGERREFQIYNGPVVTGSFINDCYLLFRDESGDYFQSIHDVDCEEQPDGSQLIKRIRLIPPVKDV